MQKQWKTMFTAALFLFGGIAFTGCSGGGENGDHQHEKGEPHQHDGEGDHHHDGGHGDHHDDGEHGGHQDGDADKGSEKDSQGQGDDVELSGFICPMKCEGTKTYEEAGSCPECGMDLKPVEAVMEEE